jgi:hypothetical protein
VGSFPGLKRQRRNFDHQSASKAEVKNEWTYTSAPPISLQSVDREGQVNVSFNGFIRVLQHKTDAPSVQHRVRYNRLGRTKIREHAGKRL